MYENKNQVFLPNMTFINREKSIKFKKVRFSDLTQYADNSTRNAVYVTQHVTMRHMRSCVKCDQCVKCVACDHANFFTRANKIRLIRSKSVIQNLA